MVARRGISKGTARYRSGIGGLALAASVLASAVAFADAAPQTQKLFALRTHEDVRDAAPGHSDLRSVRFGQRGAELWLTVRARAAPAGACVTLARSRVIGTLCLDASGKPELRYRARGAPGGRGRPVAAEVRRRHGRTLVAQVLPRALGLPFGKLRWTVSTTHDRVPDRGAFTTRIGALGGPPCFGAAARAGRRACVNPRFRRAVIPGPFQALSRPDLPCRPARNSPYEMVTPCAFGDLRDAKDPPAVALIGDSHSAHWRAALDVAAKAAGWPAASLTYPGCSFSTEAYPAPAPIPARCRLHSAEAVTWLRRHPSVRTVVTSNSAGRGLSPAGYRAIWRRVPRSVRRIYVIRDVPRVRLGTAGCVAAVARSGRRTVGACPVVRSSAFPTDPAAQAARGAGGRVRLLDFSSFFCDPARCYPVIGGAYVYRDFNHMNPVFNTTLGPYLLRAIRRDHPPG